MLSSAKKRQSRQIVDLVATNNLKQHVEKSNLEVEVIISCRLDTTKSILKLQKGKSKKLNKRENKIMLLCSLPKSVTRVEIPLKNRSRYKQFERFSSKI